MTDNFDVHAWNNNRLMESSMDDADRKAKQKVDVVYNQIMNDFPECFSTSIEKSSLKYSISSAFTELSLNEINEATEEKEYEVEFWIYRNDDYDDDEVTVMAKSEEEALALVDAIAMAIQDVTGHSIVAQGDAPEDMGPMDPMDAAPPADDFVPVEDEEALAEINVIDEEEVMNETYRRVAARLSTMNKEEKLVERIVKKLEKRLVTTKK